MTTGGRTLVKSVPAAVEVLSRLLRSPLPGSIVSSTRKICAASSRVGAMTTARGPGPIPLRQSANSSGSK